MVIKKLIWDKWNISHIARHNVVPNEVEEICQANSQAEEANKGRLRITGITKDGRILSAFLDLEPEIGICYPVSVRDSSKKERRSFNLWRKEVKKLI